MKTNENMNIVNYLQTLFETPVLMVAWPLGKKGCKGVDFTKITLDHMQNPDYLSKLALGNIGIVQGDRSRGVGSLDIDVDLGAGEFLELNPALLKTVRSHGARGCNVWLYPDGPVPKSCKLKRYGKAWGEWRHNGCQTIIAGEHPDGMPYTLLCAEPAIHYPFSKIVFPPGVTAPFLSAQSIPMKNRTAQHRPQTVVSVPCVPSVPSVSPKQGIGEEDLDALLAGTIPGAPHVNHEKLFALARRVRTFEQARQRPLDDTELREVFTSWHTRANECLRPDQSFEEYFFEFEEAHGDVKQPAGGDIVDIAWRAIGGATPPPEAAMVGDPRLQKLVTLCHVLATLAHPEPFFLACRTVQRLFGLASHERAARWMRMLRGKGIITEVTKGGPSSMKATRYFYSQAEE